MDKRLNNTGVIHTVQEVCCGRCESRAEMDYGTKTWMIDRLRSFGWKQTKRHGWVCDYCANRENSEATLDDETEDLD